MCPVNDNDPRGIHDLAMKLTTSLAPFVGKPPTIIVQALLRVAVAIAVECMPRRILIETVESLYWEFARMPPVKVRKP